MLFHFCLAVVGKQFQGFQQSPEYIARSRCCPDHGNCTKRPLRFWRQLTWFSQNAHKHTCPNSDIKSFYKWHECPWHNLVVHLALDKHKLAHSTSTSGSWYTSRCQDTKLPMQRSQNSRLPMHFPSVAKSRDAVAFGTLSSCYIAHSYEGCCTVNNTNLSRAHSIAKRCIEHAPSKLVWCRGWNGLKKKDSANLETLMTFPNFWYPVQTRRLLWPH